MKKEQKLPSWFNGELYKEGGIATNKVSAEEYTLNNVELSMYDFIIGSLFLAEMNIIKPDQVEDLKKGLEWFKEANKKAYDILLNEENTQI